METGTDTKRDRGSSHSYPGVQFGWPNFGVLELGSEGWEQQEWPLEVFKQQNEDQGSLLNRAGKLVMKNMEASKIFSACFTSVLTLRIFS